ncbi:hypothetical protein MUK42_28577 [Musa troglodytarum]|uniref:Uncharacterized protein n=1 Tax=Musa troglodytarum TaxID=320322 RepID=A0A9E7JPX1_9LILI|nr:hypothetical protein MUK42_28577 [Musa troglodytarum]
MKTFDPWPVFFKREFNRNWPFLVGFAITGCIIVKMTAGLTEEDAKNSKFVQEHKRNLIILQPLEQFACPTPHPSLQGEPNKNTNDKADCTDLTTRWEAWTQWLE